MTALLLAMVAAATASDGFDGTFARGNQAMVDKDFDTAIGAYEQLIAEGVEDPAVYFNLGNAYLEAGSLGPAIANYERAVQLDPSFADAAHNLEQTIALTERHLARPLPSWWQQAFLFWHHRLPPRLVYMAALICWAAFWTVLAIRKWQPVRFQRRAAACLFVLAVGFTLSLWAKTHPLEIAVAAEKQVPVRVSYEVSDQVHFELHEGDRVAVDGRHDGWVRVVTAGGDRGWAEAKALAFAGQPYLRQRAASESSALSDTQPAGKANPAVQ